jgi:hypothetical protein
VTHLKTGAWDSSAGWKGTRWRPRSDCSVRRGVSRGTNLIEEWRVNGPSRKSGACGSSAGGRISVVSSWKRVLFRRGVPRGTTSLSGGVRVETGAVSERGST